MKTEKLTLLRILKEKSVSFGHFTLSSGKKSSYYVDSKLTTFDAKGISLIGKQVFQIIKSKNEHISAVGGLTMGADPIAISTIIAALNENYPLKGFSMRKEAKLHGKQKLLEGNLDVTDNVVILDDVITTGNSTIKAIEAVEQYGSNIIMVIALVDRCEGGVEKINKLGYDVHAIFTINDLIDTEKIKEVNSNVNESGNISISEERILQTESI